MRVFEVVKFEPLQIDSISDMFYEMIHEVYDSLASDNKKAYKQEVENWIKFTNINLFICYTDDNDIAGFTVTDYVKDGFCNDHLIGMHCYVKPAYRKSKAAYLLYKTVIDLANANNLPILVTAYEFNDTKTIMEKITDKKLFTIRLREV